MEEETDGDKGYREKRARDNRDSDETFCALPVSLNDALNYN